MSRGAALVLSGLLNRLGFDARIFDFYPYGGFSEIWLPKTQYNKARSLVGFDAELREGELIVPHRGPSDVSTFVLSDELVRVLDWSRVHRAVWKGLHAEVRALGESGHAVDHQDIDGKSPLMLAALLGDGEMVSILLESGAEPGVRDDFGEDSLFYAAREGHVAQVEQLLEHGARPSANSKGRSVLYEALLFGNPEVARLLVLAGAEVTADELGHGTSVLLEELRAKSLAGEPFTGQRFREGLNRGELITGEGEADSLFERPGSGLVASGALAWIAGAAGLVLAWDADRAALDDSLTQFMVLLAVLGILLTIWGLWLRRRYRRGEQRKRDFGASQTLLLSAAFDSQSSFVLYLRPFHLSDRLRTSSPRTNWALGRPGALKIAPSAQLEERMRDALCDAAPLVALGHPREHFGAGRIPIPGDAWQSAFAILATRASLIFMLPSYRAGTRWEMIWLKDRGLLRKTVVLMPPQSKSWFLNMDKEWERTRQALAAHSVELPAYDPEGALFSLDEGGSLAARTDFPALRGTTFKARLSKLIDVSGPFESRATPV